MLVTAAVRTSQGDHSTPRHSRRPGQLWDRQSEYGSSGAAGPNGGDKSLSTQINPGSPSVNTVGIAPKSGSPALKTQVNS